MAKQPSSFRIGRVHAYLRGRIWYLRYFESGRRRQPRVGSDRVAARQAAAEINAQLEVGAPTALSFEPVTVPDLRQRWLDHHEHVRRSSVHTIRRYRSATEHLVVFSRDARQVRRVSDFRPVHAEEFVRYLRSIKVAPNGHVKACKRGLRDAGIKFILETCSSLFNYAQRQRHLPPYAENPFRSIEIARLPVEDVKPIVVFTEIQEQAFLKACDDWQFPLFLTLLATGLRPGELVHLLLPDDLDLNTGWLYVRNKAVLGWQTKTRNERAIPLVPVLHEVLEQAVAGRRHGPVFRQRRCLADYRPPLAGQPWAALEQELAARVARLEFATSATLPRLERLAVAKSIWRDTGSLKEDWIRKEFMQITQAMNMAEISAPKTLRHTFATILQDANVDPLIRNELMGHAPAAQGTSGGLGMTAIYTHTRPETKRRQLESAFEQRASMAYARGRADKNRTLDSR